MIKLIWYTILAKIGSVKSRNIVEVIKTTRAVHTAWNRYNWEPSDTNVKRFLAQAYGLINLDPDDDPAQRFTDAQLDQIFEAVAWKLIVDGAAGEAVFRLPRLSNSAKAHHP